MQLFTTIFSAVLLAGATALPHFGIEPFNIAPGPASFQKQLPATQLDRETCFSITGQLVRLNVPLTSPVDKLYTALDCSADTLSVKDFLGQLCGGDADISAKLEAAVSAKSKAAGWGIDLQTVKVADLQAKCGVNAQVDTVATLLAKLDLDVQAYLAFWVDISVLIGLSAQTCQVVSA